MKEKKELVELTDEQLDIELKSAIFFDDVRIVCEKFKLPETLIEEKFLKEDFLQEHPSKRKIILRSIFSSQSLSRQFLVKHEGMYEDVWLAINPNLSKELLEDLKVIQRLTNSATEE